MKLVTRLLSLLIASILLLGLAPASMFAQESAESLEQQLADMYAPVTYLRTQARQCGNVPEEGEPYTPLPVDLVLNNERILVRDESTGEVIANGPSAQELATYGPDTYLDFPGDSLRPGCTYETDERAWSAEQGLEPSVYAHILTDPENNRLILQYWFYYYFNDWNNTHESDWEGILLFWDDVSTAEDALSVAPDRVGYAQHGNGELANWGDSKVEIDDDTHPITYPAAGSHATFFGNNTYLAWGERNSGFGCDMSSPPSHRVPLNAILIPDEIDPDGEFAWLLYPGRWGELQAGPYSGPVGPYYNARFLDPWEATDNWRPFSIVVPTSDTLGPSMTDAFCTIASTSSRVFLNILINPLLMLSTLVVIIGVLAYFTRRAWPVFKQAIALYRSEWKLFTGIGLLSIPIGIVFNLLQQWMVGHQPLKFVVDYLDNTGGAALTAVLMVSGVQQLAMVLLIAPALLIAAKSVLEGHPVTVVDAYKGALAYVKPLGLAVLIAIAVLFPLVLITVLIPVAIWFAVRGHFFMQSMVFDHADTPRASFRQSFRTVQGHWWKIGFSLLVFDLLAVLPGILVGFGLLTIGRTAVGFANGISSVFYALLIPLSVLSVTILYFKNLKSPTEKDAALVAKIDEIAQEQRGNDGNDVAPAISPIA